MKNQNEIIAILGLGYVGFPLACALSRHFEVIGFDTNKTRIDELQIGFDSNENAKFSESKSLIFTPDSQNLKNARVFIIAVPTPIFKDKTPDLRALELASKIVAQNLKKGDLVIFESSTYPGCARNFCLPILLKFSKLSAQDFELGYSPERVNPGDKIHTLQNITKIIAADSENALKRMKNIYEKITPNLHAAPSIEVAEMSKLVENAQRDLNIAFVNEVAMCCDFLNLNASDVLEAAKTKWNFLPFSPGLVGGHCVSIDPYYLLHALKMQNFKPKIIAQGRKINDKMPSFLARKIYKLAKFQNLNSQNLRVLILGLSFKQNCRDLRNSKAPILRKKLKKMGFNVKVFDPIIDRKQAQKMFGFKPLKNLKNRKFDIIIALNAHKDFENLNAKDLLDSENGIIFDLQNALKFSTHTL